MKRHVMLLCAALAIAGCATTNPAFMEGRSLIESGNVEQGLARLEEATRAEPGNQEYRTYYYRQRDLAIQRYLGLAESARGANSLEAAEASYRRILALDPANTRAITGLEALQLERPISLDRRQPHRR